jgi:hypothetical protein
MRGESTSALGRQFGAERVFMDIDTMEPGVDFVEYIKTAVGSCEVLIVLIDPDWVTTADDAGRLRLDDPEDFVRVEVTAAFEREGVRVIPVLVANAPPPKKADLPPELAPLTRRQALEITDGRWDYDLGVLVKTIERLFADRQPAQPQGDKRPAQATPSWFRGHARVAIAVAALAVLAVAALLLTLGGGDGGGSSSASGESTAIPDACPRVQNGWMIKDHGALKHYECTLQTSPPPDGPVSPSLVYGLFSSAAKARKEFDEGSDSEANDAGSASCSRSSMRRLRKVLGEGDVSCYINRQEKYIAIWWNENQSRVIGILDADSSTKPENAVEAWARVVSGELAVGP